MDSSVSPWLVLWQNKPAAVYPAAFYPSVTFSASRTESQSAAGELAITSAVVIRARSHPLTICTGPRCTLPERDDRKQTVSVTSPNGLCIIWSVLKHAYGTVEYWKLCVRHPLCFCDVILSQRGTEFRVRTQLQVGERAGRQRQWVTNNKKWALFKNPKVKNLKHSKS